MLAVLAGTLVVVPNGEIKGRGGEILGEDGVESCGCLWDCGADDGVEKREEDEGEEMEVGYHVI